MNYLWQEFNIKTFPAETIVYRDGAFIPELSTIESLIIDKKYDLPVHIIYTGEMDGDKKLDIDIKIPDQEVFLTVKIENKTPAFLNINVKNAGKDSFFKGKILCQNYSDLKIQTVGDHFESDTGIILLTRIIAQSKSHTKLIGIANIKPDCLNCNSNIGFEALASPDAHIEFMPKQFINSVPLSAEHSASIYHWTDSQVNYLRSAGLSKDEIKSALYDAFINDIDLF